MQLKKGVLISGLKPEILIGIMIIEQIFINYQVSMVITSITDGKHKINSKHYSGQAVDIRSRHIEKSKQQLILISLQSALTSEFTCILESDHYHIQYDN